MNKVYLLLGSNLSNPISQLRSAHRKIAKIARIDAASAIYRTAAWGNTDQPDFLNQVMIIYTGLTPREVLTAILDIEEAMGRKRTEKNAARIIDIDILFYNDIILQEDRLIIPHPHIAQRRFVLIPLNEISPDFFHPVYQISVKQLLYQCNDPLEVKRY